MNLRYHNKVIKFKSVPKIYSQVTSIFLTILFLVLTKAIVDRIRIVDFPRIYGDEQGPINIAKIIAGYPLDVYTPYLPGLGVIYALPFYVFDNFYFAYKSSQLINLVIYLLGSFFIFKVNRIYLTKKNSAFLTLSVVSYIGITSRVAYLMTETVVFFVLSLVMFLVIKKDNSKVNYNLAIILLAILSTIHSRYMIALIPSLLSLIIIIIKRENMSGLRLFKEHLTKILIFFCTLILGQVFNSYFGSTGAGSNLVRGFLEFVSSLTVNNISFIILTICIGIVIFLMHSYFLPVFALLNLKRFQYKFTNLEYLFCLIIIWLFYTSILQSFFFARYYHSLGLEYYKVDNISTVVYQSRYFDSFIPALLTLSYLIIKKNSETILKSKTYFRISILILVLILLPVKLIVGFNETTRIPGDHVSNPFVFAITSQNSYFDRIDLLIITFALISLTLGIFLYFSKYKLTILAIITIAQIFCLENYNSWDIGITNTPNFNNRIITYEVNRNLKEKQKNAKFENLCVVSNLPSDNWWFNSKYSIYFDYPMKYSDNPSGEKCILILSSDEIAGKNKLITVDEFNNHFLYERQM
jgi:hypothetical protein